MKSTISRSSDGRIEETSRNQQVKPSLVTRIPKKPRRGSTRERGGDLPERKRPLSPMTIVLEKQLPHTRTPEQPVVSVTNPPLKKPRTDNQVETRPESQELLDLIPSLTATEIARLVAAIRKKKLDGPRQSKKRVRVQPGPTVKTEAEEKQQPLTVTPESVVRVAENRVFRPSEAAPMVEREPGKHLETGVPRLADVLAQRATRQGLPMFCYMFSSHSRMYRFAILIPRHPPSINSMSTRAV